MTLFLRSWVLSDRIMARIERHLLAWHGETLWGPALSMLRWQLASSIGLVLVAGLIFVLYGLLAGASSARMWLALLSSPKVPHGWISAVFVAPVLETLVFQVWLLTVLRRYLLLPVFVPICLVSLMFSLGHMRGVLASLDLLIGGFILTAGYVVLKQRGYAAFRIVALSHALFNLSVLVLRAMAGW